MNPVDVALAALCLWFAVAGLLYGLVRQLSSMGGIVAGHLLGIRYYPSAQKGLDLTFPHSEVVGYAVIFLGVCLAVRLIGGLVEGKVRGSKLSGMDRAAGLATGLLKGALLSVLVVFLLVVVLPKDSRVLRESKAAPTAIAAGRWLAGVFPQQIAEPFREKAPLR
ncbi:MAG TPA: CvpA family protein [Candidatus Deferrimicrobiaceae bacterium]